MTPRSTARQPEDHRRAALSALNKHGRQDLQQTGGSERLADAWPRVELRGQYLRSIARHEDEGYAASFQRLGGGKYVLAREIDVEKRDIDRRFVGGSDRLRQAG